MKTSLIVLFSFLLSIGYAQDRQIIDSLKLELAVARHDTSKVLAGMRLSVRYWNINPDSSLFYGQQSLTLAQRIHYYYGVSQLHQVLGNTYRIKGDYAKAVGLAYKGLEIAEKNQLTGPTFECLNVIGLLYKDFKDYSKAIDYLKRGLALTVANNDVFNTIKLEVNIGGVYKDQNQIDSATYYVNRAYKNAILKPNSLHLKVVYLYLGELQFQQGNYEKAFENIHKSILENKKTGDLRHLSRGHNILSVFFKKLNQPDSSIFYAKKGLTEAQEINYKSGILNASKLLAELYESKDPKTAVYYHKIASLTNDELYGSTKTLDLQKTLAEEQERQRQKEAQRIEYENQLKQYVYLAGLVVLLLIAFLLYSNNRQKHKANIFLQEQKEKVENTLSQLKSTQAQLIQSEKLASLGELTAGIAHEIQNPLNFVNNFSELSVDLVKDLKEEIEKTEQDKEYIGELFDDLSQNQEKINHHGKRASSIVKGMLEHSRASTGMKEMTDINKLADEYLRLSYHGLRAKDNSFNADFTTYFDENLPKIEVIPQDMGRVFLNLINNAFYAVNQCKQLSNDENYTPSVFVSTMQLENAIEIRVKDNGIGMSEATKAKIFQPFFTTKPTGQGTGLGLSLAYDIVTKGHGGTLKVLSTEGVGSEFIITLPFKTNG
jgi:two-component system, NtrC family, sensor kinase